MRPEEVELKTIESIGSLQDFAALRSLGITKGSFVIHGDIFNFLVEYYRQYKKLPSEELVKAQFPMYVKNGIRPDEKEFYFQELRKIDIQRKATKVLDSGASLLVENPEEAIKFIEQNLKKLLVNKKSNANMTDKDALNRYEEYLRRVAERKAGKTIGIKTGISLLDKQGIGWMPGNLIGIYARLGQGKTWLAVKLAAAAYKDGNRILFLSPELPLSEIQGRIDTILAKELGYEFSNTALQLGKPLDETKYKEFLAKLATRDDWKTLDSAEGDNFTLDNVRALIEDYKPDLVVIDGFSLIKDDNTRGEGWENAKRISYGLKNIAMALKTVMIITNQANRQAAEASSAGDAPEPHQISYGDAFGQAVSVLISLAQDPNEEGVRYAKIPKLRNLKPFSRKLKILWEVDIGKIEFI